MKKDRHHVWAFDLGKGSLGEAVRVGNRFPHVATLLIPTDFAETKTAAKRRRLFRSRSAHKAREEWLRKVMKRAGVEPLHGRQLQWNGRETKWDVTPGDEKLEREFAKAGDDTCYTSCLLRIKLLRGEKLEPWQIYKALHSAIQRRGYDKDIPWKRKARADSANADNNEGKTAERMFQFERELENMAPGKPEYHWPCYFDAWKMGLWNPSHPTELRPRQDCMAKSTRNQIIPRRLIESEIRALVNSAASQIPGLAKKADYILYGRAKRAYASYYPEERRRHNLKEGGEADWQGVLAQKVPRFDNRIIGKCALIPRLNVCKAPPRYDLKTGKAFPESILPAEVMFLLKLKNMRLEQNCAVRGLSPKEIRAIFSDANLKDFTLNKRQWAKRCGQFGGRVIPGFEDVPGPKNSGRSRFCRPALGILKRLLLSGDTPRVAYKRELARLKSSNNPLRGLVKDDLNFLLQMGPTWEGIRIPNQKFEKLLQRSDDPQAAIRQLIASQNDPIVRHRLTVFSQRLNELAGEFGTPDFVALEFVREDFMGEKARIQYRQFLRERNFERAQAREEAAKAGATGRAAGLKMELHRSQGGVCLYTGVCLAPTSLDEYCIDHIVPLANGGRDAAVNYVLTTRSAKDQKAARTPYEWLSKSDGWDAYVERVKKRTKTLRKKKLLLLTSPDAETLVQRFTVLAETALISKLAETIVCLQFGWPSGRKGGKRKIIEVSEGLTGRIRRKYKLNSLLNPDAKTDEEAEAKNRTDHRRHALDAMVITYVPGWHRNEKNTGFFRFPEDVTPQSLAEKIAQVVPRRVCFQKPKLAETIYGARAEGVGLVIVQRAKLGSLAFKPTGHGKEDFDLKYARKQCGFVRDQAIKQRLLEFLESDPDEAAWTKCCDSFHLERKNGMPGPQIKSVAVDVAAPTEYKDLSKDGTGAFRRALQGHQGQIVFVVNGKAQVRPVYVHESLRDAHEKILDENPVAEIRGFFQTGCLVQIDGNISHPKTPLKPGVYSLNTIAISGFVTLTNSRGATALAISLSKLLAVGFRRVD